MPNVEKYDDLIIGSGIAGKFTAWTRDSRRRMAIVERGPLGGACPNVACLPSKNIIWSAKVISLARMRIRSERADGRDANRDARPPALHGVARRNPDASDDVRRTGSITCKRSGAIRSHEKYPA